MLRRVAVLFDPSVIMTLKKIALYKLVILAVLMVSLALSYIPDRPWQTPAADIATQNFHTIEFNDQGEPHDAAQWQGLQARLRQSGIAKQELIIFVHGWHHNAAPTDENFIAFQKFYQQMAQSDHQRNLIGLYIGWRGDKYDPFWLDGSDDAESVVEPLDFPTIFQRKTVASRIGQQGMSQLLDALDAEISAGYLQRYTVIGHSLGGAVALHASKDRIRQAILDKRENPNLFILLNPAVNVDEYKPLDTLISLDRQKPSMVVLQSKGDFALKEAFGWMKDGQRAMGNSWAITHDVARCPRADCTKTEYIPEMMLKHDAIPGCGMTLGTSGWKIRARLQSRLNVKTCPDANMQAVWVLSVTDDIINGHNGILTPDHAIALSEIMGLLDQYRNQIPVSAVTVVDPLPEALPTVQPTETDLLLPPEAGREPKPSGESAPTSIEGELQDNVAKPSDPSTQEQMKANDAPVVDPMSKGE